MSTSISLVVSSSEESYSFKVNSADELIKYISTNLKITHFNIITEKGEKINKKNLTKLNDYFTSLNLSLSFLLIPSTEQVKPESNGPLAQSVKDTIKTQKKIKAILNSYFKNTIEKINRKLQLLNGLQIKYVKHKESLEANFNQSFGKFKTFFHYTTDKDGISIQNDFDIIEQAMTDYKKISSLYQEQLKTINMLAKEMISNYERNINGNALRDDKEELSLNDRVKVRVYNTHLLQTLIEKESDSSKKDLLNKIAEISLYKKNLEQAMSITNIPQMFVTDAKEIQNEVEQRKNFDFCFGKIMNFIQNSILVKEEERRKTFCVWLNLQNKNELYTKFVNVLYHNNTAANNANSNTNNEINGHLSGVLRQLDDHLNHLIQVLYQPTINNNNNNNKESIINNTILEKSYLVNNDTECFLQTISSELTKILKENFKMTHQDDNTLPIQDKISLMIKTLSEKTHYTGMGMNNHLLDISNASLAYSIMIDEKQQNLQGSISPNYVTAEMEKFVLKHEDKLYFYESLFEFIESFATHNKIQFKCGLSKENPQSLGNAIEQLLREGLEIKKKYSKCTNILRQLKNKT